MDDFIDDCYTCRNGVLKKGVYDEPFTRQGTGKVILIREIPAMVCDNCGEAFFEDFVSQKVLEICERFEKSQADLECVYYS